MMVLHHSPMGNPNIGNRYCTLLGQCGDFPQGYVVIPLLLSYTCFTTFYHSNPYFLLKLPIFKCTCCLWAGMYVDDVTYNVFTVQREWHNALVQYDLAGWLVVST